jgi:hypothetical protein
MNGFNDFSSRNLLNICTRDRRRSYLFDDIAMGIENLLVTKL